MKIIVPMAGMGKRMRPHTLTIPKPLIPVAGKPIVQWLVEDITKMSKEPVTEIAYVIGYYGDTAEQKLISIARNLGRTAGNRSCDPLRKRSAQWQSDRCICRHIIPRRFYNR